MGLFLQRPYRDQGKPVQNATVTIIAGERTREYTMTEGDGAYTFPEVKEDELKVFVTKEGYEPKEVTVYRTEPTKLANGVVPNFVIPKNYDYSPKTTQKTPGVTLIGLEWPEEAREILAKTEVVYDLLHIGIKIDDIEGLYSTGVIKVSNTPEKTAIYYCTLAHEIAHAHQHGLLSLDDSGSLGCGGYCLAGSEEYKNHPQGREFVQAWKKDLEEFGETPLDTIPLYAERFDENAAEIFAYWWSLGTWWEDVWEDGNLQVTAPNRIAWARKWFPKS